MAVFSISAFSFQLSTFLQSVLHPPSSGGFLLAWHLIHSHLSQDPFSRPASRWFRPRAVACSFSRMAKFRCFSNLSDRLARPHHSSTTWALNPDVYRWHGFVFIWANCRSRVDFRGEDRTKLAYIKNLSLRQLHPPVFTFCLLSFAPRNVLVIQVLLSIIFKMKDVFDHYVVLDLGFKCLSSRRVASPSDDTP